MRRERGCKGQSPCGWAGGSHWMVREFFGVKRSGTQKISRPSFRENGKQISAVLSSLWNAGRLPRDEGAAQAVGVEEGRKVGACFPFSSFSPGGDGGSAPRHPERQILSGKTKEVRPPGQTSVFHPFVFVLAVSVFFVRVWRFGASAAFAAFGVAVACSAPSPFFPIFSKSSS